MKEKLLGTHWTIAWKRNCQCIMLLSAQHLGTRPGTPRYCLSGSTIDNCLWADILNKQWLEKPPVNVCDCLSSRCSGRAASNQLDKELSFWIVLKFVYSKEYKSPDELHDIPLNPVVCISDIHLTGRPLNAFLKWKENDRTNVLSIAFKLSSGTGYFFLI